MKIEKQSSAKSSKLTTQQSATSVTKTKSKITVISAAKDSDQIKPNTANASKKKRTEIAIESRKYSA